MTEPSRIESNDPFDGPAERLACYAARLLADNHCENVTVLDLRPLSPVADYFVIATGTSDRQNLAVADELQLLADLEGQSVFRVSGYDHPQWVLLDFVDLVIHLFLPHLRSYYDLETLWGDARRVDWAGRTRPGQFARLSTLKNRSAG